MRFDLKISFGTPFERGRENKKFKTMILTKRYPATLNYANAFNELFNQFSSNPGNISNVPAVNIFETTEGYELDLNAPGRNKEDFKINVENGLLTISYEQKPEAEG